MNFLPPNGALHGSALDHLLRWNLNIVFWLFVAAQILLVLALITRLRARPAQPEDVHPRRTYVLVHVLPLLAITALYFWMLVSSHRLWAAGRELHPAAHPIEVEVTGVQFDWYFRYPGADGVYGATRPTLVSAPTGNPLGLDPTDPHSADDIVSSVLILPAGQPVDLRLRSQDVIHGFFIPGMRLKQDAIPGMLGHLQFTPATPGDYPILCSQVCGLGHYRMQARLRVVPQDAIRRVARGPRTGSRAMKRIFTTEPLALARLYFLLALVAVVTGTLLSLLMRIHRTWPDLALPLHGAIKPEDYLALVTMHGTLMVFFVLTVVPQSAFPNLVLPAQIGSSRMALPRLNAAAFWITTASLFTLLAAFFVPEGAPIAGWTSYPPFSAIAAAGPGQATGMDLWLIAITLFCLAAVLSSVSFLATILVRRCPGMTFARLPLTVWSWLVSSSLTIIAFSALFLAAFDASRRPPLRNQLLSPFRHRRQRHPAARWFRLADAVAPSLLVLRTPRGLHRHPPRHGTRLVAARQLHPPPRPRLQIHGRRHAAHRRSWASASGATTCSSPA